MRASTNIDPSDRQGVVSAMRKAAEGRCRAVTANQRRRHYGHAAVLVTACAEVDGEDGQRWAAAIRHCTGAILRFGGSWTSDSERLGSIVAAVAQA
mgnify:CR=1 FL=1